MSEEYAFQWSVKLDTGEIYLVRANEEIELISKVSSLKNYLSTKLPAPRAQANDNPPYDPHKTKFIAVDSIEFVGKDRWLVKGGNFVKYGITCFKEVLEAAGVLGKLKMDEVNKPHESWLAFYIEKQNDAGEWKPDKIVRLERQQVEPTEDYP